MGKSKLALNYALMLEMLRANGFSGQEIINLLEEGDAKFLERFGEGIPSWKVMVDYYVNNREKCRDALTIGYEISFLTKGALKSLLSIKFGLKESVDFIDTGEFLDQVKITDENLQALQEMISMNWTIVPLENNHMYKIELTYKPMFQI